MKLSLTFVLLLAGLVVLGDLADAAGSCDNVRCFQGGYITCRNYRRQKLDGCACVCAPSDGKGCVLHLNDGSSYRCRKGKPM
ncbi:hypothetical protein BRADI_1g09600v3 [Brachypodium distachyon]|uniref:Uncharacterized protein n=1 Tax=Brachypodium distachyon TaxID=15368 RepID=I1GNM2_BRADI|nr:hypothetical protein BRADI_1g09600v3 [Brachypodium distachyon]